MENDKAFPQPQAVMSGGMVSADEVGEGGMSLRAYIATAALPAILARLPVECDLSAPDEATDIAKYVARSSMALADCLIAELAK